MKRKDIVDREFEDPKVEVFNSSEYDENEHMFI